ncbi:hypothetical protein BX285_0856 [Streptomyces sp. 1114.5]|uniref:hypothetical protein n=1 Tax=unclassified Streptomyces TaxID=2593676 RepID=UPI000BD7CBE7|nr:MULTISPECIES: hypothetical protein [unclassified Streptomyces]RKT16517.1 hypothetical protein BX285_0856 [Streptomyces sp. 1114.5]SOB82687.1 hypothetical protein SAMN06272789_2861 [Streptomyces sp. 1331.2]
MNDEDLRLAPRTRAADLLAWAAEQDRAPVAEGPLRTVLALLELGEGRMHDGWPELTSNAVEHLLYERLHLYVQPAPGEDPLAYGDAVRLLIDHQRASRRLNAKRQERLHAEAEWQGEVAAGLLRRADLVTWPRLYALLLHAYGVDVADEEAVRAWLAGFGELAPEERTAAYEALVPAGWLDEPDAEGWGPGRLLSVGMATDGARRLLEQGLMRRSYRNLAELTAQGRPMPDELAGDFGQFEEAAAGAALDLFGEWTVPGLPRLLVEEFPELAPEPGREEIEAYLAQLPAEE